MKFLKFLFLAPIYVLYFTAALVGAAVIGVGFGFLLVLGDVSFKNSDALLGLLK